MTDEAASDAGVGRPSPAIVFAATVFTGLVVGVHVYFVQRLIVDTALPAPWAQLALGALLVLGASIFVHPLLERRFGAAVAGVTYWPAHVWLGATFYLLLGLAVGDAALFAAGAEGTDAARLRAVGACAACGLVTAAGARSALGVPPVVRVEHPLVGWPAQLDGYRIVQISDLHVGALLRAPWAARLVERCNALEPDLIAITGDLVDGSIHHYGEDIAPFGALRARDGVCFVTGNHDHYSGADPWVERVERLGIGVLRNRRLTITRGAAGFELAGVDDYSAGALDGGHGHDLERALSGWDGATPVVLLAHDPRSFEPAEARGVALQLSGHTHGGQLWPFSLFVRLQSRHLAGIYREGTSRLYVSRGTGFWGPPMRVLAPPEITEHVLRAEAPA